MPGTKDKKQFNNNIIEDIIEDENDIIEGAGFIPFQNNENAINEDIKENNEEPHSVIINVVPLKDVKRKSKAFYVDADNLRKQMKGAAETYRKLISEKKIDISKVPELNGICNHLNNFSSQLGDMHNNTLEYNEDTAEQFKYALEETGRLLDTYLGKIEDGSISAPKNNAEKEALKQLKNIKAELKSEDSVFAQMKRGIDLSLNFSKEYNSGALDNIIEKYKQLPSFGKPTSLDEFMNIDFLKSDPEEVVGTMLWLSSYYYKDIQTSNYNQTKKKFSDNGYMHKMYEKLFDELNEAPFDVQMEYIRHFSLLEVALNENAYKVYTDAFNNAPEGFDPKLYASIKLTESPEMNTFEAYRHLVSEFVTVSMGQNLRNLTNISNGVIKTNKDGSNRESTFVGDAFHGNEFKDFLNKNWPDAPTENHVPSFQIISDAWRAKNSYDENSSIFKLIDDYKLLNADKNDASPSFKEMQESLQNLMKATMYEGESPARYNRLVDAAIEKANAYYNSHNRAHATENGRQRFRISKNIKENLTAYKDEILEKQFYDGELEFKLNLKADRQRAEYAIKKIEPEKENSAPNGPEKNNQIDNNLVIDRKLEGNKISEDKIKDNNEIIEDKIKDDNEIIEDIHEEEFLDFKLQSDPEALKRYQEWSEARKPYVEALKDAPHFISDLELKKLALNEDFNTCRNLLEKYNENHQKVSAEIDSIYYSAHPILRGLRAFIKTDGTEEARNYNEDICQMLMCSEGESLFASMFLNRIVYDTDVSKSFYGKSEIKSSMEEHVNDVELHSAPFVIGALNARKWKDGFIYKPEFEEFLKYNDGVYVNTSIYNKQRELFDGIVPLLFSSNANEKDLDIVSQSKYPLIMRQLNNYVQKASLFNGNAKEYNNALATVEELKKQGVLNKDMMYLKAYREKIVTDKKTGINNVVRERIPLLEGLEKYPDDPYVIKFVQMSDEEKKLLDESLKHPFVNVPRINSPGALEGEDLKDELRDIIYALDEFVQSEKVMHSEFVNSENKIFDKFEELKNKLSDVIESDLSDITNNRRILSELSKNFNSYIEEDSKVPEEIYRYARSVMTAAKEVVDNKIGYMAFDRFCEVNKIARPECECVPAKKFKEKIHKKSAENYKSYCLNPKNISLEDKREEFADKNINISAAEELRIIAADNKAVSDEEFPNLKNSLKALKEADLYETADFSAYYQKLQTAIDAARIYCDAHKGYRFTANGKLRANTARSVLHKLEQHQNDLKSTQQRLRDEKFNKYIEERFKANPKAKERYELWLAERRDQLENFKDSKYLISEKELALMALDENFSKRREAAQKISSELKKIHDEFSKYTLTSSDVGRCLTAFMDLSGTDKANENNRDVAQMIASEHGEIAFLMQTQQMMLDYNHNAFLVSDAGELIDYNSDKSINASLGFVSRYAFLESNKYPLKQELLDFFQYNKGLCENPGTFLSTINLFKSETSLLINDKYTFETAIADQQSKNKSVADFAFNFIAFDMGRNTAKGYETAQKKGLINDNIIYYKAYKIDSKTNQKTRITLNDALEQYADNPDGLSFEKMSDEEIKAMKDAFLHPFKEVPSVKNPGALFGKELVSELNEMAELIDEISNDDYVAFKAIEPFKELQNKLREAKNIDLSDASKSREYLTDLHKLSKFDLSDRVITDQSVRDFVGAIQASINSRLSEKIGTIAYDNYCKNNNIKKIEVKFKEVEPIKLRSECIENYLKHTGRYVENGENILNIDKKRKDAEVNIKDDADLNISDDDDLSMGEEELDELIFDREVSKKESKKNFMKKTAEDTISSARNNANNKMDDFFANPEHKIPDIAKDMATSLYYENVISKFYDMDDEQLNKAFDQNTINKEIDEYTVTAQFYLDSFAGKAKELNYKVPQDYFGNFMNQFKKHAEKESYKRSAQEYVQNKQKSINEKDSVGKKKDEKELDNNIIEENGWEIS